MAYVTLDLVKQRLNISDTSQDNYLNQLITYATSLIDNYVGRNLEAKDYVEFYDINPSAYARYVFVKHPPVISVIEVVLNGKTLTADVDYHAYDWGILLNTVYIGAKVLRVTYRGGYDPVPSEIQYVALELVTQLYNMGTNFSTPTSERLGDQSVSFESVNKGNLIGPYKKILDKFKPVF